VIFCRSDQSRRIDTWSLQSDHIVDQVTRAILIGVDLGPNLSVTGSLATILWLGALRRESVSVGVGRFLKLGTFIMPPALLFAIAAALMWNRQPILFRSGCGPFLPFAATQRYV
jgi:arsenical pump membrane protein